LKNIKGRDYITTKGIEGAFHEKNFWEKEHKNIDPSRKYRTDDINEKDLHKFKTKAIRNPVDPSYVRYTNS
jgi:hypothetical protein